VLVLEDEVLLVSSTGVSDAGCLIASFYRELTVIRLQSSSTLAKFVKTGAPSIAASVSSYCNTFLVPMRDIRKQIHSYMRQSLFLCKIQYAQPCVVKVLW
jgi:hypothetical protein